MIFIDKWLYGEWLLRSRLANLFIKPEVLSVVLENLSRADLASRIIPHTVKSKVNLQFNHEVLDYLSAYVGERMRVKSIT